MTLIEDGSTIPEPGNGTAVSIGVYDGVHLGHQALLATLREQAERDGLKTAVITFDRHPALITRPANAPKLLTGLDQKLELIESLGIDYVYLVRFDEERALTAPKDFIRETFVDGLSARKVIVGEDFHFGRDREGNVALLHELGEVAGFDVTGLELVKVNADAAEPVSSTAIRRKLRGGDVTAARNMLGRPFEVRGEVVMGDQRGRTIGFPTANVMVAGEMAQPADAVYAGWYLHPDGQRSMAAINIGRRPTFYEHAEKSLLEAHLLDYSGDLYGQEARVQFVQLLRSEQRFDGIDALKAQLQLDIARAREVLGEHG